MKRSILILFLGVFCFTARASEVDSFRGRLEVLPDMSDVINNQFNLFLAEGIEKANALGSCNEKALFQTLRRKIRYHFGGEFIHWLHSSKEVVRQDTRVRDSIYRDLTVKDAPVMGGYLKLANAKLGPLVQFGNTRLGLDKIEHFFGTGYRYYAKQAYNKMKLSQILSWGEHGERTLMGGTTTGVISFGDLSAEFNGMRLWGHMLANVADPLGERYRLGPYIKCEENKWVQVQKVDLRNYIDDMLDESKNCSAYETERISQKVHARIYELEEKLGILLTCDPKEVQINDLRTIKYAPVLEYITARPGDIL